MLYFSRLKAAAILGACLLGVLLCLPNLWAAPNSWLPWRQIHLGLDLRGGSYLLMQDLHPASHTPYRSPPAEKSM